MQAFTAIGRVRAGEIFQAESDGIRPFRRGVEYLPAQAAPIKPMLDSLSFIRSKEHWGAAFRFGFLRVPEEDFARIAAAMGRDFARDFGAAQPTRRSARAALSSSPFESERRRRWA